MKSMKWLIVSLFLPVSLLVIMAQCDAVSMTYTDRASFEAAAGTFSVEGFEGVANGTGTQNTTVDIGDFTVRANSTLGGAWNIIGLGGSNAVNSTQSLQAGLLNGETLVLTFDTPIRYFGADFMGLNDDVPRSYIDDGAIYYAPPIIAQGNSFYGFYNSDFFTMITFTGQTNAEGVGLDNVTYAGASEPIPEPATVALLGIGLVGLAGAEVRRRRKKKAVDKS